MQPRSLSGEPLGHWATLAQVSMILFAISGACASANLGARYGDARLRYTGIVAGVTGAGIVLFPSFRFPTAHTASVLLTAAFALVTLALALASARRVSDRSMWVLGLALSIGVFGDALLYGVSQAQGHTPWLLPAFQRVTWMVSLAWLWRASTPRAS